MRTERISYGRARLRRALDPLLYVIAFIRKNH